MKTYIGIDIGGTKCAVVLGDGEGNILEKVKFPTTTVTETLERILTEAEKLKTDTTVSFGISCGGPLDPKTGVIQSPPNLPGWDNIPIVKLIRDRLDLPAVLCNDANACALAEWTFGAGRGCENMIFLTFGTGLGAGIILDGRLYNGTNGNAGEAGHMRLARFGPVGYGKQGSFEGFCSGGGIAQSAKTAAMELLQQGKSPSYCRSMEELDTVTAKSVAEAAYAGDETAKKVYAECGEMLGRGLSILVDLLNPEKIVIGSIFQRSADLLIPTMETAMAEECLAPSLAVVQVVPAELGDNLGDLAALSLAISIDR